MVKPSIDQLRLMVLLKRLFTNLSYYLAWVMLAILMIVVAIILLLDVLLPLAGIPILGERPPAMNHPAIRSLVATLAMLTAFGFTSLHFLYDPRRSQFWLVWLVIFTFSLVVLRWL